MNEEKKEKPKRGGARPGAGRKATGRTKENVTLYLSPENARWVSETEGASEKIDTLIDVYRNAPKITE